VNESFPVSIGCVLVVSNRARRVSLSSASEAAQNFGAFVHQKSHLNYMIFVTADVVCSNLLPQRTKKARETVPVVLAVPENRLVCYDILKFNATHQIG
jgi:hypothetical protein